MQNKTKICTKNKKKKNEKQNNFLCQRRLESIYKKHTFKYKMTKEVVEVP